MVGRRCCSYVALAWLLVLKGYLVTWIVTCKIQRVCYRHFPAATAVLFLSRKVKEKKRKEYVTVNLWPGLLFHVLTLCLLCFPVVCAHVCVSRLGLGGWNVRAGEELQHQWRHRPRLCFHHCARDRPQVSLKTSRDPHGQCSMSSDVPFEWKSHLFAKKGRRFILKDPLRTCLRTQ